jgi:pyrimidine operon attenuation protein/uracil phosphoribosyltransferase
MLPPVERPDLLILSRETDKGAPLSPPEPGSQHPLRPKAAQTTGSASGSSSTTVPPVPARDDSAASDRTGHRLLDDLGIRRALMRIAHEITERHDDLAAVYLVAIPNGGVPLGRLLVENLENLSGRRVPLGILDTTLYRDDVLVRAERPPLRITEMPSSVDERVVILVEDVVNTGRTIRAAMDALMDFGRPRAVEVVALIDRGHRELPIKIDFVGKNIPTQPGETVVLLGHGDGGAAPEGLLEVVLERAKVPSSGRHGAGRG